MKRFPVIYFCFFLPFLSFGQPVQSISVDSLVNRYSTSPNIMVVNFWSTWCKPCIEEIPHFIQATQLFKAQRVELLLVSQDIKEVFYSGKLAAFVKTRNWAAPLVWLNEVDANYYCPKVDSTWSGAIPSTVIVNAAKGYKKFYEESMSASQLEAEIKKAL